MRKRNLLNSPRLLELKKQRHQVFLRKIVFFFLGFLVILVGLAFLSRVSIFNIKGVEIVGNKVVETDAIKTTVEKEMAGNYLWFFLKTNVLLYPKNDIKNKLFTEFKRLKDVDFSVTEGQILKITVSERTALYTWCGDTPPDVGGNMPKCYFLDDTGYIFDEAAYFSGNVYFQFFGKVPRTTDKPLGSYFLKDSFQKLISFKKALESMQLKPVALYMEDNGDIKLPLAGINSSSSGPIIILKAEFDLQKVAENLQTALNTEPFKSDFKNKYSSLLYIDLRFDNKVYYKFR